jgi:tetratricopeptide (TPR) repeat protein
MAKRKSAYQVCLAFLEGLPPEEEYGFIRALSVFASKHFGEETIKTLERILGTKEEDTQLTYGAFYCLFMVYRTTKSYFRCGELIESHRYFSHHSTFFDPLATWTVESGAACNVDEFLGTSYQKALYFLDERHRNIGYVHAFAYYYASFYEREDDVSRQHLLSSFGQKALDCIERCQELYPEYPTYYCTKGRVLASFGRYEEARSLIRSAVQKYDSSSKSFGITLGTLQYYDLLILEEKRFSDLRKVFPSFEVGDKNTPEEDEILANLHPYEGTKPFAFVSYSHRDRAFVYRLVQTLSDLGYRVWLDRSIKGGEDFTQRIVDKIKNCRQFIFVLSAYSQASSFCERELYYAVEQKKEILPVLIDNCALSDGYHFQLIKYHILKHPSSNYYFNDIAPLLVPEIGKKA